MEERELLELAAKSIKREIRFLALTNMPGAREMPSLVNDDGSHTRWNPLEQDGDAFRLMNRLAMRLNHDHPSRVQVNHPLRGDWFDSFVNGPDDYDRAARFAIVRLAAQIGATQ